jgi:AcrR family transcriptional regulator
MVGESARRDEPEPGPPGDSPEPGPPARDGPEPDPPGRGPRRAPAPGQRQRDAERSRQALLAAALDEFSERGFAGARVADIARRAGVNKQLINYYFGSKEGLYLAVQQAWLDREQEFAGPDLPLAEVIVRYLTDALRDPRSMRLLLWRGLADSSAPGGDRTRQHDLDQVARRQAAGEVAENLDPAAVLLAGMGMIAAPVVMPQVVRELFGADPFSEEFLTRYGEQLRRIVARLAAP